MTVSRPSVLVSDPVLSSSSRVAAVSSPYRSITVFCASADGTELQRSLAADVGAAIAAAGHRLVYGGGGVGLMGVVADAALAGGGEVIGVIPEQLFDREVGHRGVTELEVVPDMHARKARMATLGDGFIALPGGFGTLEEAFEILTWNQLALIDAAVVFCANDGYWQPLIDLVDRAVGDGLVKERHRAMVRTAADPVVAVAMAAAPGPAVAPKWTDIDRRS